MRNASSSLQDLRRRLYVKAKAEPSWRFWGLYVHVCKRETLREAYRLAKRNNGAAGIDGVTFEAVEAEGVVGMKVGMKGTEPFEPFKYGTSGAWRGLWHALEGESVATFVPNSYPLNVVNLPAGLSELFGRKGASSGSRSVEPAHGGDDGCRCMCRKAPNARPCFVSSRPSSKAFDLGL